LSEVKEKRQIILQFERFDSFGCVGLCLGRRGKFHDRDWNPGKPDGVTRLVRFFCAYRFWWAVLGLFGGPVPVGPVVPTWHSSPPFKIGTLGGDY